MNADVMFSSKTDLWETPKDFFDALDSEYHFTTDVCALAENAKCRNYYTSKMNGLNQDWTGVCWCNPPYGRGIGDWVRKARTKEAVAVRVVLVTDGRETSGRREPK